MAKKSTDQKLVATFPKASEEQKAVAELTISASAQAAAVIEQYGKVMGEQDIGALYHALEATTKQVYDGDLKRAEAMLINQAEALAAIFTNFSRRSLVQEYQKNLESFFRMAMKAQNQCRMTLETLATIKNPPIVYAKQANIANGPQQVNNGTASPPAHAEKNQNQPNELLEAQPYERLDTRTPSTTSRADPAMATVE